MCVNTEPVDTYRTCVHHGKIVPVCIANILQVYMYTKTFIQDLSFFLANDTLHKTGPVSTDGYSTGDYLSCLYVYASFLPHVNLYNGCVSVHIYIVIVFLFFYAPGWLAQ